LDGLVAFTAVDSVCFPVADVKAFENGFGTLFDRDPLGNMGFFMLSGVAFVFALAMGSDQRQNKMSGILVNPLIDGLMANREPRVVDGQSSGDKFRRPSQEEAFFDVLADKVVFKPLSLMGFAVAPIRSILSFVGEVIPGINRRSVSFKLP
jgi:hypothetical protein